MSTLPPPRSDDGAAAASSPARDAAEGVTEPARRRLVRDLSLGTTAVLAVMGGVGTAFSPWLLVRMPLVLLALSPDVRHLVLAAGSTDFLPALLVSEPRRVAGVASMYGLGWYYGPVALVELEARAPGLAGMLRWCERLFGRFGAALLIVCPTYVFGALAGVARTPMRSFVPAMLLGQALYIAAAYYFGEWIQAWTAPFLAFLSEHLVESTAVCVALVAGHQAWARLRPKPE